jgi:transposase
MWIFTTSGFLSIVADERRPGHALVRAQAREDLDAFCARTGAPEPVETPERDYHYRTSVPFAVLAADLAFEAQAIDYPNFKAAVAERQGHDRARLYGRVWSVMRELRERAVRDGDRGATR